MNAMTSDYICNNFSIVAGGCSAMVFDYTADHVIRVSRHETDGWRVICFLTKEEREKFSLPRILRWWIEPETEFLIAIVERLNKLEYFDYKDNPVNLEVFNRFYNPPKAEDLLEKNNFFYDAAKKAVDLFHYCNKKGLPLVALDLNHSNFLKRKDGTLVLNDVLGARDMRPCYVRNYFK